MSSNRVTFLGTGTDDQALALKMYMGHFTEAWRSSTFLFDTTLPVIERKEVSSGKSWQFLMLADIPEPEDFDPGNTLAGQDYAVDEGTITVDKYLVSHQWIPRDQMKIAHFEILPKLGRAQANRIGRAYDKRLFITGASAARAAASTKNGLTVHSGGNRVSRVAANVATAYPLSATGAANFRADLRQLGANLDIDNIPPDSRYLWVQPYIRQVLLYDTTNQVFSRDFNAANDQQMRKIVEIEGFKLVGYPNTTTNNGPFPDQNLTSGLTKYQGDFSVHATDGTPVALALTGGPEGQAAVGVVTFEKVVNVVKYYDERMSWLVMSFLLAGAGQLNPYCAGSIEVASS